MLKIGCSNKKLELFLFCKGTNSSSSSLQLSHPEEELQMDPQCLKNGLSGCADNNRFTVQPSGEQILDDVVLEPVMQMFAQVLTV